MQARVTQFEIDTLRISLADAVEMFKERVLPRLRAHPGCQGVMALSSPEGKGLLLSFWETAEAADEGVKSGFYDEQVQEFTMVLRQPPGREHYEVVLQEISPSVFDSSVREGERP
jgi:heme-degrading monooxygenase HmoA